MQITVHLSDGAELTIADFNPESALDLVAEFRDGDDPTFTFDMDGATVLVARHHVVRIDLETGAPGSDSL